ncbi:SIR2 family protein [Chloroflexi bacterium TSY]|nr:SIR2 family protein [Chloroflexi bacterium TSY]
MSYSIQTATVDDLMVQMRTHSQRPDYMLWLGAGASVASGVPTADEIVTDLLQRVYQQRKRASSGNDSGMTEGGLFQWAKHNLDWFNPKDANKPEYALVMENVHPPPGMRERYLKELTQNARPSDGYKYLGILLREGIFDTVITTNFDHLVFTGVQPYLSQRIVEFSSVEQFQYLESYPDEPRLIRLHGDFLHGNTLGLDKNTLLIQYAAISQLLRTYGLIVIGYGGRDQNIMYKLFEPLTENPPISKYGIWWCHRKNDPLSHRVEMFLEKAPNDQAFLVEIDDFDAMMATMAAQLNLKLPPNENQNLLRLIDNLQNQYALAWDWRALLIDFVDATRNNVTEQLKRLAFMLNGAQAILACYDSNHKIWRVIATAEIPTTSTSMELNQELVDKIAEKQRTYMRLTEDERAVMVPRSETFSRSDILEIFPVYKAGRLLGFIVFGSKQPILDYTEIRLVRALVQLLVKACVD